MKSWLYPVLRIVCILLMGVLLIVYRETWAQLLVGILGGLLAVYGLVSVVVYLARKSRSDSGFFVPVAGGACMVLGVLLMVKSKSFIQAIVYVAAALLVAISVSQLVRLVRRNRRLKLSGWFFVVPILALLIAVVALWNPMNIATLPMVLTGVGCVICAIADTIVFILFRRQQKFIEKTVQAVEDAPEEVVAQSIDHAQ